MPGLSTGRPARVADTHIIGNKPRFGRAVGDPESGRTSIAGSTGMPSYRVSGPAVDRNDIRAHGKDDRLRTDSYDDGVEFYQRYLKVLTSGAH